MYKNRNTGTGNGMQGTRDMGECYIPGNVDKHSGECRQTFQGMSSNIPGNVAKHSGKCRKTFKRMSPNILGNVIKHSGECCQTFRWMSSYIPGNVLKYSEECPSAALLLHVSSVATRKIHLAPWGIEAEPLLWELAATATMLQWTGGVSKHITLNISFRPNEL